MLALTRSYLMKRKAEVRLFVDEWLLRKIDGQLGRLGATRSEVCRYILMRYFEERQGR